jgi:hypothetical protein
MVPHRPWNHLCRQCFSLFGRPGATPITLLVVEDEHLIRDLPRRALMRWALRDEARGLPGLERLQRLHGHGTLALTAH